MKNFILILTFLSFPLFAFNGDIDFDMSQIDIEAVKKLLEKTFPMKSFSKNA